MKSKYFLLLLFLVGFQFTKAQTVVNEYVPEDLDEIERYLKRINSNYTNRISGPFSSKVKINTDVIIVQNDSAIIATAALELFMKDFVMKSLKIEKCKGRNTIV